MFRSYSSSTESFTSINPSVDETDESDDPVEAADELPAVLSFPHAAADAKSIAALMSAKILFKKSPLSVITVNSNIKRCAE